MEYNILLSRSGQVDCCQKMIEHERLEHTMSYLLH